MSQLPSQMATLPTAPRKFNYDMPSRAATQPQYDQNNRMSLPNPVDIYQALKGAWGGGQPAGNTDPFAGATPPVPYFDDFDVGAKFNASLPNMMTGGNGKPVFGSPGMVANHQHSMAMQAPVQPHQMVYGTQMERDAAARLARQPALPAAPPDNRFNDWLRNSPMMAGSPTLRFQQQLPEPATPQRLTELARRFGNMELRKGSPNPGMENWTPRAADAQQAATAKQQMFQNRQNQFALPDIRGGGVAPAPQLPWDNNQGQGMAQDRLRGLNGLYTASGNTYTQLPGGAWTPTSPNPGGPALHDQQITAANQRMHDMADLRNTRFDLHRAGLPGGVAAGVVNQPGGVDYGRQVLQNLAGLGGAGAIADPKTELAIHKAAFDMVKKGANPDDALKAARATFEAGNAPAAGHGKQLPGAPAVAAGAHDPFTNLHGGSGKILPPPNANNPHLTPTPAPAGETPEQAAARVAANQRVEKNKAIMDSLELGAAPEIYKGEAPNPILDEDKAFAKASEKLKGEAVDDKEIPGMAQAIVAGQKARVQERQQPGYVDPAVTEMVEHGLNQPWWYGFL
jgi:hypothetical protein